MQSQKTPYPIVQHYLEAVVELARLKRIHSGVEAIKSQLSKFSDFLSAFSGVRSEIEDHLTSGTLKAETLVSARRTLDSLASQNQSIKLIVNNAQQEFGNALPVVLGEMHDQAQKWENAAQQSRISKLTEMAKEGGTLERHLIVCSANVASLAKQEQTLNKLLNSAKSQYGNELPTVVDDLTEVVKKWRDELSRCSGRDLDQAIKHGDLVGKEIESKSKQAIELRGKLGELRKFNDGAKVSMNKSAHPLVITAASVLDAAKLLTSAKLSEMLALVYQWCTDVDLHSSRFTVAVQNLSEKIDELYQLLNEAATIPAEEWQSYREEVAGWVANVQKTLDTAKQIQPKSASALVIVPELEENIGSANELISTLRDALEERKTANWAEQNAAALGTAKKVNFFFALIGVVGFGIGVVWLHDHVTLFGVAAFISIFSLFYARSDSGGESTFWTLASMLSLALSVIGLLVIFVEWLLGWLFNHWSLIGWLPHWLPMIAPLSFAAIFAFLYAVLSCCLFARNFIPVSLKARPLRPGNLPPETTEIPQNLSEQVANTFQLPSQAPPLPPVSTNRQPVQATMPAPPPAAHYKDQVAPTMPPSLPTPPPAPKAKRKRVSEPPLELTDSIPSSSSASSEIPAPLLSRIRDRIKREHRGDSAAQRDEMEAQVEAHQTLQQLLADPPHDMENHILMKIVSKAQREYPLDIHMQVHDVEQQIESHAEIQHFADNGCSSELPREVLTRILKKAEGEHPFDFSMQANEVQEQMAGCLRILELRSSSLPGVNRRRMGKAIAEATEEYPEDYSMQVYYIEQKFETETD